jgi:hypothetical protein
MGHQEPIARGNHATVNAGDLAAQLPQLGKNLLFNGRPPRARPGSRSRVGWLAGMLPRRTLRESGRELLLMTSWWVTVDARLAIPGISQGVDPPVPGRQRYRAARSGNGPAEPPPKTTIAQAHPVMWAAPLAPSIATARSTGQPGLSFGTLVTDLRDTSARLAGGSRQASLEAGQGGGTGISDPVACRRPRLKMASRKGRGDQLGGGIRSLNRRRGLPHGKQTIAQSQTVSSPSIRLRLCRASARFDFDRSSAR